MDSQFNSSDFLTVPKGNFINPSKTFYICNSNSNEYCSSNKRCPGVCRHSRIFFDAIDINSLLVLPYQSEGIRNSLNKSE